MYITYLFIIICVLIFIYINFISKDSKDHTIMKLGALYPPYVRKGEYYRLITNNFIHENFLHLFMNMYCIYSLGRFFEQLLGPLQYIGLLLSSMLLSSLVTVLAPYYFPSTDHTITIGASGVFYGFLGALIGLALLIGGIYMEALQSLLYVIVINLAYTFMMPGISKTGHLGGLIGGYLYIYIMYLVMRVF